MQRSRKSSSRRANKPGAVRAQLSDGPSYSGQQSAVLKLEGTAFMFSTTVTTGVIAGSVPINAVSSITGFAARFGSTFDEYRVLGADVRISCLNASTGVSKMWFDEKSTTAPTLNESQERTVIPFANTNAVGKSRVTMRWRARDLLDLQYSDIATGVTPVSFKVYTNNAQFGASIVAAPLWLIEPVYIVEFRGIKST